MAEKTIAQKLQIKPDMTVWLSDPGRLSLIQPLPAGVRPVAGLEDAAAALVFAENAASLTGVLSEVGSALTGPNLLWVAYPKGNRADINRDSLWPLLQPYGLRPIGQVAVDDVWSALRFRPLKPGEAPFAPGQRP